MIKEIINKVLFVMNPQPTRGMMKFVKQRYSSQTQIIGAEIGVAAGYHAYKYLSRMKNIEKVYLIDPYEPYVMDGIKKDFSHLSEDAYKRLSPFQDRIEYVCGSSKVGAEYMKTWGELLDFVYIDANHEYKYVLQDLELWYPLVQKYGVIGGHDFSGSNPGVAKAVIEFAEKRNIKIHGAGADWWFKVE